VERRARQQRPFGEGQIGSGGRDIGVDGEGRFIQPDAAFASQHHAEREAGGVFVDFTDDFERGPVGTADFAVIEVLGQRVLIDGFGASSCSEEQAGVAFGAGGLDAERGVKPHGVTRYGAALRV
jgi:hypothetical protein